MVFIDIKTFRAVTMGYDKTHKVWDAQASWWRDDTSLRIAWLAGAGEGIVHSTERLLGSEGPHIIVDCTGFSDPAGWFQVCKHWGCNREILRRLLQHEHFGRSCRALLRALHKVYLWSDRWQCQYQSVS